MSSSLENCDVRSISIGSKISLLFKESAILEGQSDLIGIVETVKNQGDKNSDFPEIWDLLDKIWIQIGENKRIYGVIVDGTGGSIKSMQKLVDEFKSKGYDVSMLFVDTSLDVALERNNCLLYTSPSPRDRQKARMPSSA